MFTLPCYVGIILRKGPEVLLVKRHNTDWASGQWNFPGGLLEEHETLLNAAIRETLEEVGVHVNPSSFELVHVLQVGINTQNTKNILGFYFEAHSWQGTPVNNEPHRHSEAAWFNDNHLPSIATQHAVQVLEKLKTGIRYSEDR